MCWRERLVEAVRASGRTQKQIAARAGITPESLSRVLTGHSARPSFLSIAQIAYAAGTSLGWVLGEEGFDLSPLEVGALEAVIWVLQDVLERVDSAELLRLRAFLDDSTMVAVHSPEWSDAEDIYVWRRMIQRVRRDAFRERLAKLRPVLGVFRGGRLEVGGTGGATSMLYLRSRAGRPIYVGGAHAAEAQAIVEVVNVVLDLCEPEESHDSRAGTTGSSGSER